MIIVPTEKRFDWKHTPVVLISIVLLNTLIFFIYQTADEGKINTALELYNENDFLKREWPIFQQYLTAQDDSQLVEYQEAFKEQDFEYLSFIILSRQDFYEYLRADAYELIGYFQIDEWSGPRERIHNTMMSVSSLAHGLTIPDISPTSLVTHQFLHGSFMHFLGNMFFLIICGFAVEAAIGHLRFLAFYLTSGIAAGLAQALFQKEYGHLIGASGAISGVMAMYLGIFRLKKIEFFYWFFIFVGYIRVPALLVLPFYIGKEIYSYYSYGESNVAFMAHAGGFIAGALLIAALIIFKRELLNEEYIEENQSIDTDRQGLAEIHRHLDNYKFSLALKTLEQEIKNKGEQFDLLLLRFKICKLFTGIKKDLAIRAFAKLSQNTSINTENAGQLHKVWMENQPLLSDCDPNIKLSLAKNLVQHNITDSVEKIIDSYKKDTQHALKIRELASKLAVIYGHKGEKNKSERYRSIALTIEGSLENMNI